MSIGYNILICVGVSFSVSIIINIAIKVKWIVNINELLTRREKELSIEYRILKEWWLSNQYNDINEVISNNKKKYKRFIKLSKLFNKGKLQQ